MQGRRNFDPDREVWLAEWDGPTLSMRAADCLCRARVTSAAQLRAMLASADPKLHWTFGLGPKTMMELFAAMRMAPPRKGLR